MVSFKLYAFFKHSFKLYNLLRIKYYLILLLIIVVPQIISSRYALLGPHPSLRRRRLAGRKISLITTYFEVFSTIVPMKGILLARAP